MKKKTLLFTILLCVIVFAGCSGQSGAVGVQETAMGKETNTPILTEKTDSPKTYVEKSEEVSPEGDEKTEEASLPEGDEKAEEASSTEGDEKAEEASSTEGNEKVEETSLSDASLSEEESFVASNGDELCGINPYKENELIENVNIEQRSATPSVLTPAASGINVKGNNYVSIDISNSAEGYIIVKYLGSASKVRVQITTPSNVVYTYTVKTGVEAVFPLCEGSGNYAIGCFENISGNQYARVYNETISFAVTNQFGAFLYPNQCVTFNTNSACVAKASELATGAKNDLEVIDRVYDYVVENIVYDDVLAQNVKSGYLPNPDTTLSTGKGICQDYAALMCAMLRSQKIPCKFIIGYAKDAYHAWISVYTSETGWIDNMIEFDGVNWTRMDPTYAANTKNKKNLKKFIGDGSNYKQMYAY